MSIVSRGVKAAVLSLAAATLWQYAGGHEVFSTALPGGALPPGTTQSATGETRQLTDAGRGQVTGLWDDLGRFKTPTIRALAARAPYFHNGTAATLGDVVRHYEAHLGFVFTDEERADLVAFLNAL